jgi:glycosyltransferase involved in cell wall biosynthesis
MLVMDKNTENTPIVDIFVPVYNEKDNIKMLFDSLSSQVRCPFNVMIVYDMEEDNTLPVIAQIKNDYEFDIRLVKNLYGRGALNAFRTGMESIEHEYLVFTMADLSDSLDSINEMYQKLLDGYDMVGGSRYIKGGGKNGGPLIKTLFSWSAGISLHILTRIPLHDISNGFKMYRREVIESIKLESAYGFEIGVELAVKTYLEGYKITEIPVQWQDRESGKSQFKMWKWLPHYFKWYLFAIWRTWFGRNLRKRKTDNK